MRISDWSSDVCSSDLVGLVERDEARHPAIAEIFMVERVEDAGAADVREAHYGQRPHMLVPQHGFEPARERRIDEQRVEIHGGFGGGDGLARWEERRVGASGCQYV